MEVIKNNQAKLPVPDSLKKKHERDAKACKQREEDKKTTRVNNLKKREQYVQRARKLIY
jgi:hypothetical protein